MKWIFLSPHLDDVVFSCGGLIWDLIRGGQSAEIWTVCTADPPPGELSAFAAYLHQDWGLGRDAYRIRREEDQAACQILGAQSRYLSFLDCIYRRSPGGDFLYDSEGAIFAGLDNRESVLIDQLTEMLDSILPEDIRLVAPLGIGNHVDHELVRKAANRLSVPTAYYADYPYAREPEGSQILDFLLSAADWSPEIKTLSEAGIGKWIEACQAYSSQLGTFWENMDSLKTEIQLFSSQQGGISLWYTLEDD